MYCLALQQQASRQPWIKNKHVTSFSNTHTQRHYNTHSASPAHTLINTPEPESQGLLCGALAASVSLTSSEVAVVLTVHVCFDSDMALPPAPAAMATEPSCCMCNCKSTLRAILLELRTMRKLIQTQRGISPIPSYTSILTFFIKE